MNLSALPATEIPRGHPLPLPQFLTPQKAPVRTDPGAPAHGMSHDMSLTHLRQVIGQRQLNALFQPIVSMGEAKIIGYEGLIRGPSDSPLHSPLVLFKVAHDHGMTMEVEHLCRQVVLEAFSRMKTDCKLFINVSPDCLLQPNMRNGETLRYIHALGLDPNNVIIELTENASSYGYDLLRKATDHYRDMGFEIAIDDLGEGFSSLRLWSELRPDYVKIDKHFISGIHLDPVKLHFVRSIQQIAENSGSRVIAEGIEHEAELAIVRDLNIAFGQGYHFGRPSQQPLRELAPEVSDALDGGGPKLSVRNGMKPIPVRVEKLLKMVAPVSPETSNDEVFRQFEQNVDLHALPVVDHGIPVGLISRYKMIDGFARPYHRELYGRRPCVSFMDDRPLIVEKSVSLQELSDIIVNTEPHHLSTGFIIIEQGMYLGMGSGHALLREITQMQISAARYANPLTLMPGNVPINEHIERLLDREVAFHACYCDLDAFKPFNDVYGFRRGDEVIQFTGKLLAEHADAECDFVGHIGGDDFIVLFRSPDWEARCQAILEKFGQGIPSYYDAQDVARGGIETEDRQGARHLHPLISLSIGAVRIAAATFGSHHEVAAAATAAKKAAKRISGNSLFIERRSMPSE